MNCNRLAIAACALMLSGVIQAAEWTLLSPVLSASTLTKGLPLTGRESLKSGKGQLKQRWEIKGGRQVMGSLETIGNQQGDLINLGGQCREFDKQGMELKPAPWPKTSFCHRFFVRLMANTVQQPDAVASLMLAGAQRAATSSFRMEQGDISIELASDGYFFMRRVSRIGQ